MNSNLTYFNSNRFKFLLLVIETILCISSITRIVLLCLSFKEIDFTFLNIGGIFIFGLFYDLVNASYFIIPFALYLWLCPSRWYSKQWSRAMQYVLYFLITALLIFNAVSEFFFWDEFNTRFNFIAVDYLVYTTEVIGNIQQSYPIKSIVIAILVLSIAITYIFRNKITSDKEAQFKFKTRTPAFVALLCVPLFSFFFVDAQIHHFSTDAYANELAGNGMYELFAAYRNNELDYERFYTHISDNTAFQDVRENLQQNFHSAVNKNQFSIEHEVKNKGPEKNFNVVLISIESFSAEFMKMYGNTQNITPFLDSLAQHSMVFTNLYATGTRTVRGLEALSLSVPPTPGQSIVRRPNNEHLFSLASVFKKKGYACKYIYGGYGYFDNMNYFFGNNDYEVVDRSALASDEIDYENIWGVADENLFTLSLREIDKSIEENKHVFAHVMTTSNHRPFTYPDGRIDIPSHTGREGAVKYTDYAIGKFIKEASKKSWYSNTIFVITADHCASSAGKTELPINKYQIPMLIFSPGNISPSVQDRLMSQIDIAPTILGRLNFSYTSKFFGYDIFQLNPGQERAFVSTYQALGFLQHDTMVVLSPLKDPELMVIGKDKAQHKVVADIKRSKPVKDAISWYQAASYAFKHGDMKQ